MPTKASAKSEIYTGHFWLFTFASFFNAGLSDFTASVILLRLGFLPPGIFYLTLFSQIFEHMRLQEEQEYPFQDPPA